MLIDNGSENLQLLNYIKKKYKVKMLLNKKNMGLAAALNQGIEQAYKLKFPWILTMAQDSIPHKNLIKEMFALYKTQTKTVKKHIAGIFPIHIENNIKFSKLNKKYKYVLSDMTSGSLLKTSIVKKTGGFDEKLFIDYVDHEFYLRCGLYGYKFLKCFSAGLNHHLGELGKKYFINKTICFTNHTPIRRYYITKNRLYVYIKYFHFYPKFIFKDFISFIKETLKIILFEKQKIIKIIMIIKGFYDFAINKYGKIH